MYVVSLQRSPSSAILPSLLRMNPLEELAAAALRGSVNANMDSNQQNTDWRVSILSSFFPSCSRASSLLPPSFEADLSHPPFFFTLQGMETLIAALQANAPNLSNSTTSAGSLHHDQAHPHPFNQQTLNALLLQPNILSILSLLPQPPLPDPNLAPVKTRSGRPSRPPQVDDQLLQLQQAAWAGLDPSFFSALNQGDQSAGWGSEVDS